MRMLGRDRTRKFTKVKLKLKTYINIISCALFKKCFEIIRKYGSEFIAK